MDSWNVCALTRKSWLVCRYYGKKSLFTEDLSEKGRKTTLEKDKLFYLGKCNPKNGIRLCSECLDGDVKEENVEV